MYIQIIYFQPILTRLLMILVHHKRGRHLIILLQVLEILTMLPSRILYDGLR